MTLPTSGALTLSAIAAEFGGATPHSLSEYYAGGAYVASGTSGTNGAVPSSGAISFSHFYGTSAVAPGTLAWTNSTATTLLGKALAFTVGTDATVYRVVAGAPTAVFTWLTGGTTSNFEIMATLTSGAATGTFGSWLNLGTDRVWSDSAANAVITIQIRDVATHTKTISGTLTFAWSDSSGGGGH